MITDFSGRGPEAKKPMANSVEVQRMLEGRDSLGPFALATAIRLGSEDKPQILVNAHLNPSMGIATADIYGLGETQHLDFSDPITHRVDGDIKELSDFVRKAAIHAVDIVGSEEYKKLVAEIELDAAAGVTYIGRPDHIE
jgi:hypothetical protein